MEMGSKIFNLKKESICKFFSSDGRNTSRISGRTSKNGRIYKKMVHPKVTQRIEGGVAGFLVKADGAFTKVNIISGLSGSYNIQAINVAKLFPRSFPTVNYEYR